MAKGSGKADRRDGDLVCAIDGGFYVTRMNMRTLRSVARTTGLGVDSLHRLTASSDFDIEKVLLFLLGCFLPLHPSLTIEELDDAFDNDKAAFSKVFADCMVAYTKAMGSLFPQPAEKSEGGAENPQTAPGPQSPGASPT